MTENFLFITKATDLDAGKYVVTARNGIIGPAEEELVLIIYPLAPTLTIKAEKTLFEIGDDVMLPCEITAYPPPDIKWYKITYQQGRRKEEILVEQDLGMNLSGFAFSA